MTTRKLAALAAIAAVGGCAQTLECADGTHEVDGMCVGSPTAAPYGCGPGTRFDPTLAVCVAELSPAVCDPGTTFPMTRGDGVTVCMGAGDCDSCAAPLPCPTPEAGKVTLCGRLIDTETMASVSLDDTVSCDPDAPAADGPCSLRIEVYDALKFVTDPMAPPQAAEERYLDACGRFRFKNVTLPGNRSIGIGVDDAGSGDAVTLTGIAMFLDPGDLETGVRAFATRHTTVDRWTESAGYPFGTDVSFATKGVFVPRFLDDASKPVAGVIATVSGAPRADRTYYFSDQDHQLTMVDVDATETGPNGAALLVESALTMHGGTGQTPAGCAWESALAASVPGLVFVQEKHLVCE